ncbi:MAG: Rpn family recombination-promoting nuclease/putative transposase [Victivallales bacterium]|nr:Rpn family recombination-promoting nuclease/putative transposase [Victivallales bacterium]
MGRLDYWAKIFFQKPEIFAALFNGYLFQGKNVISPSELVPQSSKEVFTSKKSKQLFLQRERDLLFQVAYKQGTDCSYLLLGLEAQAFPDASMPLRCMLYDAINYSMQLEKIQSKQAKLHPGDNAKPFLNGLPDNERLTPIITLVIALTDDPWPRTRELHELLALPNPNLVQYIANYRINLITPATMSEADIQLYGKELEAVLLAARAASDRKALKNVATSHDAFHSLNMDTARLIMEITQLDFSIQDKKENIDMAKQIVSFSEYFRQEGREEGLRRGTISTLLKLGKSQEEICTWLMENHSLTEQQARQEIANYQKSLQKKKLPKEPVIH